MTSGLRQYITGYTVVNLWRDPIRRRDAFANALECMLMSFISVCVAILFLHKTQKYLTKIIRIMFSFVFGSLIHPCPPGPSEAMAAFETSP